MGAGKTVITLTILSRILGLDVGRVLIIGPKRVIETTWPDEIAKWEHTAWMDYCIVDGPTAKGKKPMPDCPITLVSKDNATDLIQAHGGEFDMVVVDELSTFKNPQSKRFKALKRLNPERFIGLTGTPAPNGIPDLWAQMYLIDKGQRLGRTLGEFRQTYLLPGRRNGFVVYEWLPKPQAQEKIYAQLSDICMSLKDCADLPGLSMIETAVRMPESLMNRYKAFARQMVMDQTICAANAGVLCGMLSQFTSGEIYEPDGSVKSLHTLKLDALADLIEQAQGNPVMVFYYYKHEKRRILERFSEARALETAQDIRDWNSGKIPILLVHPASAGHGLNLQNGGNVAVWYSLPSWNLELYEQANARIYRQGQEKPCVIYHIITRGTIDERQMKALESKSVTQNALVEALRKEIKDGKSICD